MSFPLSVMEEISKCVRLGVFFLLLCPATMQANDVCNDFSPGYFGYHRDYYGFLYEEYPYYNSRYTDLYQKFEDALVSKSTLLGNQRVGFISKGDIPIYFRLKLELMNGTDIKCKNYSEKYTTFCRNASSPGSTWILCGHNLVMKFSSQTQAEEEKQSIDSSVLWLSLIHGNIIGLFGLFLVNLNDHRSDVLVTLNMDKLDCNPSLNLTKCALSELISWVCFYNKL